MAVTGLLLYRFLEYEVQPPSAGWTSEVKIYRKAMGGTTRVVDKETGEILFLHLPEYDGNIYPISVQKIDETHWQVVFEKPDWNK